MSNKHGFRLNLFPIESKSCVHCRKRFKTQDPNKRFCSKKCQMTNWRKYNKDKLAIIQKRCRQNQKANFAVEE